MKKQALRAAGVGLLATVLTTATAFASAVNISAGLSFDRADIAQINNWDERAQQTIATLTSGSCSSGVNCETEWRGDWSENLTSTVVTTATAMTNNDGATGSELSSSISFAGGGASSSRQASFNVSDSGFFLFTIPYSWSISTTDTDGANVSVSAQLIDYSGISGSRVLNQVQSSFWTDEDSAAAKKSGNLYLSFYLPEETDTTYYLTLNTSVRSGAPIPTPIPAAGWMLGTGLLVLVGLRRKKN